MDVSIKSEAKQQREAAIKARRARQESRAKREEKRIQRRNAVIYRRLQRRLSRKVRAQLLKEKKLYASGYANYGGHYISTEFLYGWQRWQVDRDSVEDVLRKALAEHTGFEYEVDYYAPLRSYGNSELCSSIRISYKLLAG